MLEESENEVAKSVQAKLIPGRKWKAKEAVNNAKENLKIKEIIGHTQTNRQGLGSTKMQWLSKTDRKEKETWSYSS